MKLFCMNATDRVALVSLLAQLCMTLCWIRLLDVAGLDNIPQVQLDTLSRRETDWFIDGFNGPVYGASFRRTQEQQSRVRGSQMQETN